MANLSVTEAWNETMAFVRREARLILPIAFLLVALPGALMQILMPTAPAPGEPPELGLWLLLVPIVVVAGMVGSIAITYLALRPGTSVGEALQLGLRRFIMLLGASLLVGLGFVALLIPLVVIAGGGAAAADNPAAFVGSMVLVLFLFGIFALAVWVRLMLMTPVTAAEDVGLLGIIRRSWELTRGHFWKLLGLVVLLLIAGLIIMMVVSMVLGILVITLAGPPDPQSLTLILLAIVSALLQSILGAIFAVLIARIYHQLSGGSPEQVFA